LTSITPWAVQVNRPTFDSIQVTIQIRLTDSRFSTGISFVFCGASPFGAVEAMKVPAPHREKQSKTIAIFVNKFTD
jgi:hypothetical protein